MLEKLKRSEAAKEEKEEEDVKGGGEEEGNLSLLKQIQTCHIWSKYRYN
jgi:hypothetical protein